jgi:lipopolysaccharide/colanic/teichoic acid biosynthesis glycosyltransferase
VSFNLGTSKKDGPLTNNLLEILKKRLRTTDEIGFIDEDHVGVLLHNTPPDAAGYFANHIGEKIDSDFFLLHYKIYTYPTDQTKLGNNYMKTQGCRNTSGKEDGTKNQRSPDITNSAIGGLEKKSCRSTKDTISTPIKNSKDIYPLVKQKLPAWKRFIDITGSALGLVFLSPIFLVIAIVIKITSPGPVFFKQERVGCCGRRFTFWKFRTMAHNLDTKKHKQYLATLIKESNEKPMAKIDNELQLIPFGEFLRKSCLDELPQLYNVLRGDMSLVGPRPPIPYEVNEYKSWHTIRLNTIPGMTGLWQVSGKNRLSFSEMVRLDIRYIRHINMLSEIKILMLTPISIIFQGVINGRKKAKT